MERTGVSEMSGGREVTQIDLGVQVFLAAASFPCSTRSQELLTAVDRGDASALQPLLESRADPEAWLRRAPASCAPAWPTTRRSPSC